MHRRKKYLGTFNISKRMLTRFVDFKISNHKGLYVRISVIDTIVPVNERYCTKYQMLELLYPVIGTVVRTFVN